LLGYFANFFEAEFAGEDDAVYTEVFDEGDATGFGKSHLGGAVDGERGDEAMYELGGTEILDDDGVNTGGGDGFEIFDGFCEFIGEEEGVEGEETFNVVGVEVGDELREFCEGEIFGAETGVEMVEAEVDGIGTVGDGGAQGVPISGGGKEFGFYGGGGRNCGHCELSKKERPEIG